MKTRLAKKIMGRISRFRNIDSNYLPYSKPQQTKAVRIAYRGVPEAHLEALIKFVPCQKVPLKWRKIKGFIPDEFDNLKAE